MWYEHLNILGLPFGDALANSLSFPITVLNWCLARLVIWLGKYSHSVQMAKLVTALGPHPLSLAYLVFLWAVSSLLGRFHYKYAGYVDPFAQAMDSVTSIRLQDARIITFRPALIPPIHIPQKKPAHPQPLF